MNPTEVFVITLACMFGSAMGGLLLFRYFPPHHRGEETRHVIRSIAGIFVTMTALVMGLMINTAKNRFDGINRDLHSYATNLILLDRTLATFGPGAMETRARLKAYVVRAAGRGSFVSADPVLTSDMTSEQMLNAVGDALRAITPSDSQSLAVWNDARQEYGRIVELRWALVEQAESSIPPPLLVLVVCWLILVFGSYGYGAPANATVVASLFVAAALIAAALDLTADLDVPYSGYISVSPAPLQRVLAELQR